MRKLLVDPQTAGGLLASIPSDKSDKCVEALIHAGYAQAARIGFRLGYRSFLCFALVIDCGTLFKHC